MKRILYFTYGTVVYAMFFGILLYLIGFVAGVVTPTTLDKGIETPFAIALLINLGLVAVFGLQHSIMARPAFKRVWTKIIPAPIERPTYVLATNLALALMFWQWRPIGPTIWEITHPVMNSVLTGLCLAGFGIVVIVTFLINHFDLFGLRQVWLYLLNKPYTHVGFRTPGPYKHVRHPLYVGWLIAFWATPLMTAGHLVFAAGLTAYILVAIYFEERNLAEEHGERYLLWRRRTPMLVPRLRTDTPAQAEPSVRRSPEIA